MLVKLLFYSAILFALIGLKSAESHLFFFFSAHLTMLTIGYTLYRREKRVKRASTAKVAVPQAAATKAKKSNA
jgi:hypothetical protein